MHVFVLFFASWMCHSVYLGSTKRKITKYYRWSCNKKALTFCPPKLALPSTYFFCWLQYCNGILFVWKVIRELSGLILTRGPKLCNFVEWRGYKVVYRRCVLEIECLEFILFALLLFMVLHDLLVS
jgi:hypothetical protein